MCSAPSFTATCRQFGVDPWRWLRDTLTALPTTPADQLANLLQAIQGVAIQLLQILGQQLRRYLLASLFGGLQGLAQARLVAVGVVQALA